LQLKAWLKHVPKTIDIVRRILDNVKDQKNSNAKSGLKAAYTAHFLQPLILLTNTINDRMFDLMKVTALIRDDLVNELRHYAKGKTLTESLTIALEEWLTLKKIKELNESVKDKPLEFSKGFSAENVRFVNRR
jgi:hypothetical protein